MFEMDTFDTWWEENYGEFSGQSPQTKRKMNMAYDVGVEHQQAKVEELQKQLNEYIFVAETLDEMYVKEAQKSDELQKRVDKAIRLLVEAELYQSEPNIDLAVKALKGEG